jgi:hypothetical protein
MLTLVDGDGTVVSKEPQFVCNGATGPQGAVGPAGPAGPGIGFRQVFLNQTAVPTGSAPQNSIGSITATIPVAGSVLVMASGQCAITAANTQIRLEVGVARDASVANSTAANNISSGSETSALRTYSVARSFAISVPGRYEFFLNAERVAGAGTGFCFGPMTVFLATGGPLQP